MFDRAGDDRVEHRQGKVIGLGSPTGEDKVGAAAACQHRDFRSCLFDDHPRGAAMPCTDDGLDGGPIASCIAETASGRSGVVALLSR